MQLVLLLLLLLFLLLQLACCEVFRAPIVNADDNTVHRKDYSHMHDHAEQLLGTLFNSARVGDLDLLQVQIIELDQYLASAKEDDDDYLLFVAPFKMAVGLLWHDLHQFSKAIPLLEETCRTSRQYAHAHASQADLEEACPTLIEALMAARDFDKAVPFLREELMLDADNFDILHKLAHALTHSSHSSQVAIQEEAKSLFLRALTINPKSAQAWMRLGFLTSAMSPWHNAETIDQFGHSLELLEKEPSEENTMDLLDKIVIAFVHAHKSLFACRWNDSIVSETLLGRYIDEAIHNGRIKDLQMFSVFEPRIPSEHVLQVSAANSKRIYNTFAHDRHQIVLNREEADDALDDGGRLRIGYAYSPGYTSSMPTTRLTQSLYAAHNSSSFDVYCYSIGEGDDSAEVRFIRSTCRHYHHLPTWTYKSVAEQIVADKIHILIDLCGFAAYAVPQVFAHRPAPMAVQLHGYPLTMGAAEYVQYMIGDRYTTPPEYTQYYSEKMMFHPSTLFATSNRDLSPWLSLLQKQYQPTGGSSILQSIQKINNCPVVATGSAAQLAYEQAVQLESTQQLVQSQAKYFESMEHSQHSQHLGSALCPLSSWYLSSVIGAARLARQLQQQTQFDELRALATEAAFGNKNGISDCQSCHEVSNNGVDTTQVIPSHLAAEITQPISEILSKQNLTREALGIPADATVLCSFNAHWKIREDIWVIWMNILALVPNSVLWLAKETVADSRHVLLQLTRQSHGADVASRVLIGGWTPWDYNLMLKAEICSLALDTPFFNGHTTTFEMTWAGIPVLTYPQGELFFGRLAASLVAAATPMETIDHADLPVLSQYLITHSLKEYQDIAVHLLNNKSLLAKLTLSMRAGRIKSTLTDLTLWTQQYEVGLKMWWDVWKNYGEEKYFHVIVAVKKINH